MNIGDKIMAEIKQKLPAKTRLLEIEDEIKRLKSEKKLLLKQVGKIGLTEEQKKILGDKPKVPRLSFSKTANPDSEEIKKYNNYMMMKTYYINKNKIKAIVDNMD
jgi:hypothetical protein